MPAVTAKNGFAVDVDLHLSGYDKKITEFIFPEMLLNILTEWQDILNSFFFKSTHL